MKKYPRINRDFAKLCRIIYSCNSEAQWRMVSKYVRLFKKMYPNVSQHEYPASKLLLIKADNLGIDKDVLSKLGWIPPRIE